MAPRRKRFPQINKLLGQGLTRQQVIRRMTGESNWAAGALQLTNKQLQALGYSQAHIRSLRTSRTADGGWQEPDQSNDSAFDVMKAMLNEYGLGSLAGELRKLIEKGVTDQASITLELQNTNEWKQRFAGNEALRAKGLGVLSPGEYLAVERSYAQVLRNYGLPEGFYDDPSDFAAWIGGSVSAAELQTRAQAWSDLANREDSAVKDQLRAMGMGEGDLLAYMMDPSRATPLIQRKYQQALIGGAARRAGLNADTEYAGRLAELGIDEQQAATGYGVISEGLGTMRSLGDVYGDEYGQRDFEEEVFEGSGNAARKRRGLASQERAAFGGQSGIGRTDPRRTTTGQF